MNVLLVGNIAIGLAGFEGMLSGYLMTDSISPNAGLALRKKVGIASGLEIEVRLKHHLVVSMKDVGGRRCRS
jgi:hypothetical protein